MISERSSAVQMLSDPDEGPFLQAIVCVPPEQPTDDAVWLRYAELLERRKDPRGEFLRLDRGLSVQGSLDELTSVHQALPAVVTPPQAVRDMAELRYP